MSAEEHTRFRCKTCNSTVYSMNAETLYDKIPILSLHEQCEVEFFTEDTFDDFELRETQNRNTRHSTLWFLRKARIINRIGYAFTFADFERDMNNGAFRSHICRLKKKGKVVKIHDGVGAAYYVKGEKRWDERRDVTLEGMGVGLEFEAILRDCAIQYPKMHDIKIQFPTPQLHQKLQRSITPDERNGLIKLPDYEIGRYQNATISVYPNTVVIDIACTKEPLVYDTSGSLKLVTILNEIRREILVASSFEVDDIPECMDWIVSQYHFNKDSRKYCKKDFEVTVNEMSSGFIRFYSKKFPDGKTRTRLEQIRTPKNSLREEIQKMIKAYRFVHGSDPVALSPYEASELLSIKKQSKVKGIQYRIDSYFV